MIVLFLDSNALNKNPHLDNEIGEKIRAELALGEVEIHLSPIVVAELKRQEMDDLENLRSTVTNTIRQKTRGSRTNSSDIRNRFDATLEDFRHLVDDQFDATAADPCITIVPWPGVSTSDLVARELQRRRPFLEIEHSKKTMTVGQRDALIWEGARESARRGGPDQITIFVSGDSGFSKPDDRASLHEDLLEDLRADGIDAGKFFLVEHLTQAHIKVQELRSFVTPTQSAVASLLVQATYDLEGERTSSSRDGFGATFSDPLEEILVPREMDDAMVVAVDLIGDVTFEAADGSIARQQVIFTISGSVYISDWYGMEESDDLEYWGRLNERYVDVAVTRYALVEASVVFEDERPRIIKVSVKATESRPRDLDIGQEDAHVG